MAPHSRGTVRITESVPARPSQVLGFAMRTRFWDSANLRICPAESHKERFVNGVTRGAIFSSPRTFAAKFFNGAPRATSGGLRASGACFRGLRASVRLARTGMALAWRTPRRARRAPGPLSSSVLCPAGGDFRRADLTAAPFSWDSSPAFSCPAEGVSGPGLLNAGALSRASATRAPTFARGATIALVRAVAAIAGCGAPVGAFCAGLLNAGASSCARVTASSSCAVCPLPPPR